MINLPPGVAHAAFPFVSRPAPVTRDGIHRFQHFAMACPWSLWLADVEFNYAAQLAQEIWDEVDRLENELSRFIVSSDIYRLNAALRQGDEGWIAIGNDAWECLYLGLAMGEITDGAFDIALGQEIEERRGEDDLIGEVNEPQQWDGPWSQFLRLAENPLSAKLIDSRAQIDLGALGKGFSLDKSAQLLHNWGLQRALFFSGQSTVVGIGSPSGDAVSGQEGWPVDLRHPDSIGENARSVGRAFLHDMALSGSAQVLHGGHIIDGRTGVTANHWRATWAVAPTAAFSDACSTAFMAMDWAEIREFCAQQVHVGALVLNDEGQFLKCGLDVWDLDSVQ